MNKRKNIIIPLIISISSLWTLINILFSHYSHYSLLSVIVGIISIVLYYKNHNAYDKLYYIWAYMQAPCITYGGANFMNALPLSFSQGFTLELSNDKELGLYFNSLSIGIYSLIKWFNADKPLGHTIKMGRLRKGTFPNMQFPITGTIEAIVGRQKIYPVYQVNLDNEITIRDKTYKHIYLEPQKETLIQIGSKRQVGGLRVCEIPYQKFNEKENRFIDWVTIDAK